MYRGNRTQAFRAFLKTVLSYGNLKEDIIDNVLLDDYGMSLYNSVFTHSTSDSVNNYESLEFLGDTTLNKSIAWYLSKRFPQLNCQAGVKVITRLKINLISKKSFAGFAKHLGFWPFVSCDEETRQNKMDKVCEDVFEAFFAATEIILDNKYHIGVGYNFCYNLIATLLDSEKLSLRYEDLFDTKTRLKELFDHMGHGFGVLKYTAEKVDRIFHVKAWRVVQMVDEVAEVDIHLTATIANNKSPSILASMLNKLLKFTNLNINNMDQVNDVSNIKTVKITKRARVEEILIGTGTGALKQNAEQFASRNALRNLKQQGFFKDPPEGYRLFSEN